MDGKLLSSKNEKSDGKVLKTFEVINSLKACEPTIGEVTKAAQKYTEMMLKLCDAGKILADVLGGLAEQHGGDLGDGLRKSSDILKQLEAKRSKQAQTLLDSLIEPYTKGDRRPDQSKQAIATFEKQYKTQRGVSLKNIKKYETTSRKLAKKKKKDQRALDEALASLSKSVEMHDSMLGENLRAIIVIDRTRYCQYLKAWNEVLLSESEGYEAGSKLVAEQLPELQALADETAELIPEEAERLIRDSKPDAALRQLEKVRETGYFPAGFEYGDNAGDGTMGSTAGTAISDRINRDEDGSETGEDPLGGHPVATYKVRVKQRYDAQQEDELSLVLGDIFDVTAEIDENWAIAEVHGKRGMFPSNHIEKMRRAGS